LDLAERITRNAPIAVKYAKACIDRGMDAGLENGILMENELFAMCYATEDQKEGMTAFLEKRKAEFRNR
jgi:enoyl-CoA hydratase